MDERRIVVVGAGPAGLASAAELGRRGLPVLVLEQADRVASSWRGRYDRLRLNSSRPFSKLPGAGYRPARFRPGTGMFPTRDELVQYLEDYAEGNGIDVHASTRLERIDRDADRWILRTSRGDVRADQVIVAAGYDHTPHVPDWPGRERFQRPLVHAAAYRNPQPYQDADVLVVGPGCSGMEIAYELAVNGARRVRLAVRTPPNILIRSPIGPLMALLMLKLPPAVGDAVTRFARRHEVGDLSEYGLPVPDEGIFSRLRRLKVAPAIVDMEVIEAIKDRRIEIVSRVDSLDETGVRLAGGDRIEPDAVIAATGYRQGLEPVVGHLGLLDERGAPRVVRAEAAPGLRFIGYSPRPAHMRYMGREARQAAKEIARLEAVRTGRHGPSPARARVPRLMRGLRSGAEA